MAQNFTASFIKSVLLKTNSSETYNPIIPLGETLSISFDDLEANQKNYYYTVEHCSYNWKVSNINTTEYIDGYSNYEIQDFKNSFNTLQDYTHHYFQFPNENTKIKISGNYLLTVLNDDDEICIQRRFVVYESLVNISARKIRDRNLKNINKKQVIQFSIFHPDLKINNPSKELKVCILQNNDWNFSKKEIKPQYFKKDEIAYQYNQETSFYGGNEFLNFDTKNLTGSNIHIARTALEDLYHSYLYPNTPRYALPYTYFPDINGGFTIRTLNGSDNATESDYTWVHFVLETNADTPLESTYIYGAFNNYAVNTENELVYNENTQFLEGNLLLKQGFYNYIYATKNEDGLIEKRRIGGSFYETENKYTVLAYYKPFGNRIGKIIAVSNINTN